jgi:hypothetical protein
MKIKRIGQNEYEVTRTKKIKDKDNQQVEVFDKPITYGLQKAKHERDGLVALADALADPKRVATQRQIHLDHIAELDEIITAIEGNFDTEAILE